MWSDRETEYDFLGYQSYVEVLVEICLQPGLSPLALGVFGAWGSGKTSLMKMMKSHIDQTAESSTKTLWFNAWRYEGREEAQSALIHAILKKTSEDKTLTDDALGVLKRLKEGASVLKLAKFTGKTLMTLTPDLSDFIDCFREESERVADTMEGFENDFESYLDKVEIGNVVIFIDDLDRCSDEKVLETFETIKLFLNTPACTFVIGADVPKIHQAVENIYSYESATKSKDYLEKIIQLPFNIPEQSLGDIVRYVGMLLIDKHMNAGGRRALIKSRSTFEISEKDYHLHFHKWIERNRPFFPADTAEKAGYEISSILSYVDIFGRGLRGNPRQIKRFLNIWSMRKRLAKANDLKIEDDLLIKMTVLEYVWEDFFVAVAETVDPKTGRSELVEEVLSDGASASRSKLVEDSREQTGLLIF